MATEAQIAANRRNAQRSTGPKSVAGKAKVAQNALRHGLAANTVDAEGTDRVRRLADALIGDGPRSEAIEGLARLAAESQYDLERARLLRALIFQRAEAEVQPYHTARTRKSLARLKKRTEDIASDVLGGERKQAVLAFVAMQEAFESPWRPETEAERQAVVLQRSAGRLVRLDRYEGRALSRRRRALNDLLEASRQSKHRPVGDGMVDDW